VSEIELIELLLLPVPNSAMIRSGDRVVVREQELVLPELEAPTQEVSTNGSVCEDKIDIEMPGVDSEEGILV
jgi:hypothetical protein